MQRGDLARKLPHIPVQMLSLFPELGSQEVRDLVELCCSKVEKS